MFLHFLFKLEISPKIFLSFNTYTLNMSVLLYHILIIYMTYGMFCKRVMLTTFYILLCFFSAIEY